MVCLCALLPFRRQGSSAMRRPDEWIELEVKVDSGACISVMPIGYCESIDIIENDLSLGAAHKTKFQKMLKTKGPMGLGPKTQNFTKIIKIVKTTIFLQRETDARRNSSKV